MEISYQSIKEKMEQYGYFAEDELIWQTYINIQNLINNGQVGQDIHAICLEGPPGAGKTEYAKIYRKVLKDFVQDEVELIDYQCDSTTGKSDLYEEIRVAAAIAGNPDEVIIAGKLVEAIDSVNAGKKVILFLDEYDKAREETDAFLLKFLQEGRVNTTQRGDVEIKPENMQNLQVLLCKNQMREELSGPLERRVKILRLKEMRPEVFFKVASHQLPNADKDVINAVSILYGAIYDNKDDFARMPSCSEGLLAIRDACTLLKANAPEEFVYSAIISNMLKNPDDIETFRSLLGKDERLSAFFKSTCDLSKISNITEAEIARREILSQFFSDDIKRVSEDIERANRLLTESDHERSYLEKRINEQSDTINDKDKTIEKQRRYIEQLLAERRDGKRGVSLFRRRNASSETISDSSHEEVSRDKKVEIPSVIQVGTEHKFVQQNEIGGQILAIPGGEDGRIHLGESILEQDYDMLQKFGYATIQSYSGGTKLEDMRDWNENHIGLGIRVMKSEPTAKLYSDGIILYDKDGIIVGATRVFEETERRGETGEEETGSIGRYKFFTNRLVLPIYVLDSVAEFMKQCYNQGDTNNYGGTYIDCIVSADKQKDVKEKDDYGIYFYCVPLKDNIYHITYENYRNDLYDTGKVFKRMIATSEYDDYMKAELLRIANSRERQMIQTGQISPKSTQYVKPLVTHGERD